MGEGIRRLCGRKRLIRQISIASPELGAGIGWCPQNWVSPEFLVSDLRTIGSALAGEHAGYWRWRIGHYRVVARIEDERITVVMVRVA